MQTVKIFYLVDLNTFKGTYNKESTGGRYCFVNSKNEKIVTKSLDQFLREDQSSFLGFLKGSDCDLRQAFDFKTFLHLDDAVEQFAIKWHEHVKPFISKTTYELVDNNKGLKIRLDFVNNEDLEQFNRICENESIGHGFERCKLGAFYDMEQHYYGK
jgi:hypothetical protein